MTDSGWKYFYELDKTEKVLQWDKATDSLSWVKPLNYFEYDIDDEMVLLENRHTSQLITKNHTIYAKVQKNERKQENGIRKVISKKDSEYIPYNAEELKNRWNISLPLASTFNGNINCEFAYMLGWWFTDAWKHKDGKACMFSQSKPDTLLKLRKELDRLKQLRKCKYSEYIKEDENINHNKEHTFYVTGELAEYLLENYNDREPSWNLLNLNLNSKRKLLSGLMDGDGSYKKGSYSQVFWSQKEKRRDIVSALLTCVGYRNYIFENGRHQGVVFNTKHSASEISYKHRKPLQKYTGTVYCLETETGAFVVRRNGKPFISGNSGFPKSMNIGLAIDKKNGVESEIVAIGKSGAKETHQNSLNLVNSPFGGEYEIKKAQNEWNGWGTALKPSFEPIIVARKPLDGTCVDNVIKWGVGGINIDECRVPFNGDKWENQKSGKTAKAFNLNEQQRNAGTGVLAGYECKANDNGRFPANTILTYDDTDFEEVCGGFPNTKSSGGKTTMPNLRDVGKKSKEAIGIDKLSFGQVHNAERKETNYIAPYDSGSASRYFYNAKASKRDRDCDGTIKNIHPTCKPTSLMQYLVRLVTPKGGTVLDPFMGSGSTGKAVAFENKDRQANYSFIGIEREPEYCDIAKARIDWASRYEKKEVKALEETEQLKFEDMEVNK